MGWGLVTAVGLAYRECKPFMLKIAIRYLEHGPQKLSAPHLKDSQIISIVHHTAGISITVNHSIGEAVYWFLEFNRAWRFFVHLASFSD
jgi:hypothetical protein